jgi:phage regulator Rha-like protein
VPDAYGRDQPAYDLTREGFTLLAMGWTGEKAMAFKVRYIRGFNEMEAALRSLAGADELEITEDGMRRLGGMQKAIVAKLLTEVVMPILAEMRTEYIAIAGPVFGPCQQVCQVE